MPNILPIEIDGTTIYVEVEPRYGSEETTSIDEMIDKARDAFQRAEATVTSVAKSMVGAIHRLDEASMPSEFGMEIAIKFSAEGNAILAKGATEANLKITMKYQHKKQD